MITVSLLLLILAAVLLLIAALGISHPRCHFGWLGLFSWLLSTLIGHVR